MISFGKNKILIAGFIVFAALLFAPDVFAKETVKEIFLDETTVAEKGYTVRTPDNAFAAGVRAGTADGPLNVVIKKLDTAEVPLKHGDFTRISDVYELNVKTPDGQKPKFNKWLQLRFQLDDGQGDLYHQKMILFWDNGAKTWRQLLTAKENLKSRTMYAVIPFDFSQVAIFEHPTAVEGFGSWYNYQLAKNRIKYSNGVATHLYPQGTELKITNLKNSKSVEVKVVSYWDKETNEKRRRALDIVKASFSKIASVSEGVVPVRIEVIPTAAKTATAAGGGEEKPAPKTAVQTDLSSIKSRAAIVMDEGGDVLFEKNSNKVYPVASISKLFTVEAVLKTNPDWKKQVKLLPEDDAEGARLFSPAGDLMTVKDLFYSTLTGSTNNGAKALARSTGLSNEEFAAKMNELAKTAGLKNAKFYEPTGLDIRNVSTAKEIALFSLNNLNRKEIIEGTTKSVYSFDEILSVDKLVHHDVKSTNILLKESHPAYEILSSKTGFLYESLHCLMMKVKSKKDGKIYTAVILGAPTSAVRFSEMRALLAKFVP